MKQYIINPFRSNGFHRRRMITAIGVIIATFASYNSFETYFSSDARMLSSYHDDDQGLESSANEGNSQLILPNILLLGAQKAGSTSVANWLFSQRDACHPKKFRNEPTHYKKETHFFDDITRYEQGIEFFAARFKHCTKKGSFIIDATPDYLIFPERIAETYAKAGPEIMSKLKLIVVLREPISRELSLYNHKMFHANPEKRITFEEHANSIVMKDSIPREGDINKLRASTGKYVDHLKKFASFFKRDQLLVLSYDEMKAHPKRMQRRIQQFLSTKLLRGKIPYMNQHDSPEKLGVVSEQARQILEPFFKNKNEELYEFLDKNPGPSMEQRPFPRFL